MRKTANYTVPAGNRDSGKLFVINEMSSWQGESWGMRAILALLRANVEVPDNFEELGMAGIATLGLKALGGLDFVVAKPLLDEMMDCVHIIPDPKKTHISRPLIESDVEEISTLKDLRVEWGKLHLDFLMAVAPSLLQGRKAAANPGPKRVTKMSPESSES